MRRLEPGFTELSMVTRFDLSLAARRLAAGQGRETGMRLPLAEERKRLILPGLILVEAIMKMIGADSFRAVARDLRWGVILSGGIIPEGYCEKVEKIR